MIKNLLSQNLRIYFLSLCIVQMLLIFIQEDIIGFRADFFQILEKLDRTGLEYAFLRLIEIGAYALVPLKILANALTVGFILWIGIFTFGYKAGFKEAFRVALLAYSVFFIPQILKIIWFGFIDRSYSESDLNHFHGFSLVYLLNKESSETMLYAFLSSINGALIIYIILLQNLMAEALKRKKSEMIWVVLVFYLGIAALWLAFTEIIFS